MLQYNKLSAWITVDDKPLEEYDVEVDEGSNRVTCWIASEVGKPYKVHWRDDEFRWPTSGWVHVDGHGCGGKTIESKTAEQTMCMLGIRKDGTTCSPFTFSSVRTSDEDSFLSAPAAPDIGSIRITIEHVRILERNLAWKPQTIPVTRTYHEKTKKMVDHQTSFDQPAITTPSAMALNIEPIGPPVAIFQFRYRPLAVLQAQDIAPRPPPQPASPSPPRNNPPRVPQKRTRCKVELDSDGEPVAGSDEEEGDNDDNTKKIADLERQLEALRKQNNKGNSRKKIKREPIVGLTIDLTED
ncbi:hypothetical protein PQX77_005330 [Marasmius sp. AFHP31]|nr:hypothetical protein PQX77_005330 [Marasmius sp. AFHP31]